MVVVGNRELGGWLVLGPSNCWDVGDGIGVFSVFLSVREHHTDYIHAYIRYKSDVITSSAHHPRTAPWPQVLAQCRSLAMDNDQNNYLSGHAREKHYRDGKWIIPTVMLSLTGIKVAGTYHTAVT